MTGTIVKVVVGVLLLLAWLYILSVLDRAKLNFWHFLAGSLGFFLFLMVLVRPVLTEPLARGVAAIAGLVGTLTGTFSVYFRYGILFIEAVGGAITLQIDFECSGIIEIMAFLSLLLFFRVYTGWERAFLAITGTIYIVLANALRVTVICEMIHFFGPGVYYLAHTLVGRIVFYVLSILLYFYVFTKPQIVRMKIGKFSYENH